MTDSRRRGNAGRHAWATWMLAVGLWIGMSIPALAAIPTTLTVEANRGADRSLLVTATVTPAEATGTVQFKIDGVNTGSPVTVTAGTAQAVPITDLPPGNYTVGAEYSGDATHSASSATAPYDHPDKAFAHISLSYDQTPGPQLVPIIATIDPPDATGSIVFRLNGTQVGPAVFLVAGRAESIPVDFPEPGVSYSIGYEYSGDDNYQAILWQLISDWRPESPEEQPVAAASPAPAPPTSAPVPSPAKKKTLPRTGSDPIPMALLAVALIGCGCVLVRAGRDEVHQSF